MKERVVLAYSGGLDTSVAIGWIGEVTGAEVIAVAADVGQGGEDLEVIRERALACGAVEAEVADARDEFADEYCLPALKADALYMDRYPLVSALSRPVIVRHLVAAAAKHGAGVVAHGCTGKGNDQVRFEVGIGALAPQLRCIAPVRDYGMTRDKAIDFAERAGLPIDVTKKSPYSIDQNVWGRAVETGFLEDIWNGPVEDVYSYTQDPSLPRDADEVVVTFDRGAPVALDGRPVTMLGAVAELNRRAGAQGVGRLDLVEDRLVGIKSREVYEAPGAIALLTAHAELVNVTVERDLARFARGVSQRWAELVYDGLWFSPLKRALDGFLADVNEPVSGDIRMRMHGGRAVVSGRRSSESLYDYSLATYDTGDTFDQSLAKGFIDLWGLPSKIAARRDLAARPGEGRRAAPRTVPRVVPMRQPIRCGCGAAGSPADRRRPSRRCRCRSSSTGGWRRTTWPARARTPGCCTAPGCSTATSCTRCSAPWTSSRPTSPPAPRCRGRTTRTCTPRWSGRWWSGWVPWAGSCGPAGRATTKSRPTSACTCAPPPDPWCG